MANVPSFRSSSSFRGNMRTYPHSGFVPGEHPNVPSFQFSFPGTSAKTTLLATPNILPFPSSKCPFLRKYASGEREEFEPTTGRGAIYLEIEKGRFPRRGGRVYTLAGWGTRSLKGCLRAGGRAKYCYGGPKFPPSHF